MKVVATCLLLLAVSNSYGNLFVECRRNSKTTIFVKACGDKGVKGVEVELVLLCQNETVRKTTDDEGKTVFDVFWGDVKEKRIMGFSDRKIAGMKVEGDSQNQQVTVNVCSR